VQPNHGSAVDKAAKNAPAGSDIAVRAMKQMITAANSAYDNFNKAAKQATEHDYWITSSARSTTSPGTEMPSALAALNPRTTLRTSFCILARPLLAPPPASRSPSRTAHVL